MIVYLLDGQRIFLTEMNVDEYARLSENISLVPPPTLTGTEVAHWNGKKWNILPNYPGPSLEDWKHRLRAETTQKRWDVMTGGMTLPGGIKIGTTIDDQNRITSVVANAALAGLRDEDEVDFKAVSGWVRLSIAQIKDIAGAIGQFVQLCYAAERTHHEAIDEMIDVEQAESYDVTQGWPS